MVNNTLRVCKLDGSNSKCVRDGEQYGYFLSYEFSKLAVQLGVSRRMVVKRDEYCLEVLHN